MTYIKPLFPLLRPYRATSTLVYHCTSPSLSPNSVLGDDVPSEVFEIHMRSLHERGMRAEGLGRDFVIGPTGGNERCVLLTFDDGYLDTYRYAFPILQRYGFSATVFLVTDSIGKMRHWGCGKPFPLMDWAHIKEMSAYGISFHSHTCTHPDLTAISQERASYELVYSKKTIEDKLGLPADYMAYPFGAFNRTVMSLAEDAGYTDAYAFGPSPNQRLCRERFVILPNDGKLRFRLKTNAWSSWVRTVYRACGPARPPTCH
jgi:peptidoglycan/xylan/chitin deacetylase (PgdA/CDA1 family)